MNYKFENSITMELFDLSVKLLGDLLSFWLVQPRNIDLSLKWLMMWPLNFIGQSHHKWHLNNVIGQSNVGVHLWAPSGASQCFLSTIYSAVPGGGDLEVEKILQLPIFLSWQSKSRVGENYNSAGHHPYPRPRGISMMHPFYCFLSWKLNLECLLPKVSPAYIHFCKYV